MVVMKRVPSWLVEATAECIGTFLLVLVGDGSIAQHILSNGTHGQFLSVNIGYGIAAMLASLTAGGVTGGQINPAVTVGFTVVGKLPWTKMLYYVAAQYLGAFIASAIVLLVYQDALYNYDSGKYEALGNNGTAAIWATFPQSFLSQGTGVVDQIVGTFVLVFAMSAIYDYNNMLIPTPFIPLYVGLTMIGVGVSFGYNCGYAINPARDFAPRLFSLIIYGKEVFTYKNWWWIPIVGPHVGGILGAITYTLLIEIHWNEEQSDVEKNELPMDVNEPENVYAVQENL